MQLSKIAETILVDGHFVLSSGLHTSAYNETALLTREPALCEIVGNALLAELPKCAFEYVVSPAIGGLIVGFEVARQAKRKFVFCERDWNGTLEIGREQTITEGTSVVIVDNVFTTGTTLLETVELVKGHGAKVARALYIVQRGQTQRCVVWRGIEICALFVRAIPTYAPDECPLCAAGIPVTWKGSRPEKLRTSFRQV
jgi:orotate phosphoribosyltransferase